MVNRIVASAVSAFLMCFSASSARAQQSLSDRPCSVLLSVATPTGAVPSAKQLEHTLIIERKRMKVAGLFGMAYATHLEQICVTLGPGRNIESALFTQMARIRFTIVPNGPTFEPDNDRPVADAYVYDSLGPPSLVLTLEDPPAFNRFTAKYAGRRMSIVLDGRAVASPVIERPGHGSDGVEITGGDFASQFYLWAALLSSGPLPTIVRIVKSSAV